MISIISHGGEWERNQIKVQGQGILHESVVASLVSWATSISFNNVNAAVNFTASKSIGHQWFWSYEYSDFKNIEFDSYINSSNSLFRLINTDIDLILAFLAQIRIIISSLDVIHAWTIPSLRIKIDATPGRLNQISFFGNRSGIFFG